MPDDAIHLVGEDLHGDGLRKYAKKLTHGE
jgi:hypothetical protein